VRFAEEQRLGLDFTTPPQRADTTAAPAQPAGSFLAIVREARELAALPEQERKPWEELWADVAALLKRCQ
jgi:hypothetical protein